MECTRQAPNCGTIQVPQQRTGAHCRSRQELTVAVSGTEGARQGRLRGPTLAAAGSRRSTGSRQALTAAAAGTRSRKARQMVQEEQTQKPSSAHCGCRRQKKQEVVRHSLRLQLFPEVAGWHRGRSQLKSSGARCGCCRYRRSPPRTSSRSHSGRCRFQKKHRKSSGAHCGCSKHKKS